MDLRSFYGRRGPTTRSRTMGRRLPPGFWKGSTSTYKKRAARVVRVLPPIIRRATTAIATRVAKRQGETKYATQVSGAKQLYASTTPAGYQTQLYQVIPPIEKGPASNERVGDKIRPTKMSLAMDLVLNPELANGEGLAQDNSWDITAHVWYGTCKRYKNASDILANVTSIAEHLLDEGGGVSQAFTGDLRDTQIPVNRTYMNVKHKKIRLFKSYGTANTNPGLGAGVTQYFPDRVSGRLNLSFSCPSVLKYDDADEPENFAPFVIIGYQYNDGRDVSVPPYSNTQALEATWTSKLWYKDE